MSFDVIATEPFERKLKKLSKKHKSLKADLLTVVEKLAENPTLGTPLGKECYKIRVTITFKGKGKSGGPRLITSSYSQRNRFSSRYLRQIRAVNHF